MPLAITAMPTITVSSGGTTSNAIRQFDDAWALTMYCGTTFTSTSVRVTVEHTDTGTAFVILQSGGSDVTLTSGRATVFSPVPFRQIRVLTNAAEDAPLIINVTKTILT